MRTEPEGGDRASVERLFRDIQTEHPSLAMHLELEHEHVDLMLTIPSQNGLDFDIKAYLDGDELHLTVGSAFWLEWFPSEKPDVWASYVEALRGLLAGTYRVVEYHGVGPPVKAHLQKREAGRWKTIGRWGTLGGLLPWPRSRVVLCRDT